MKQVLVFLDEKLDDGKIPEFLPISGHMMVGPRKNFLPDDIIEEVMESERKNDLLIGGFVEVSSQTLTLWKGTLESFVVPFDAFTPSGDGTCPDFAKFQIIDYGNTLKLGKYEAAADLLIRDFCPNVE